MAVAKPKRSALRTIEDIERRQQEVRAIEIDAMRVLVGVLRDVAVALPVESKLPYDIADCAKALEKDIAWVEGYEPAKPAVSTSNALRAMRRELSEEIQRWRPEEGEDR